MIVELKDLCDGKTDAIIVTEKTTKEDIQKIIDEVKATDSEWQYDEIIDKLPDDCTTYSRWANEIECVYY